MKSIIVAILIIIGQTSFANERAVVELTNIGSDTVLSDSETSLIGLALDDYLLQSRESLTSVKAVYSCTEVFEDIIICYFKTNLTGNDATIAIQYDRVNDDILID